MRLQVERQTASPSDAGESGRGSEIERHALAQLDRGDVVRKPDQREGHAKWLPRQREPHDDHERESAEREIGSAPARRPRRDEAAVDEPGDERRHFERVERTAALTQPHDAGGETEREQRQRHRDRAPGEPLERRKRRQPEPQDVGRPSLQPAAPPRGRGPPAPPRA